jgi:hypothetical protein
MVQYRQKQGIYLPAIGIITNKSISDIGIALTYWGSRIVKVLVIVQGLLSTIVTVYYPNCSWLFQLPTIIPSQLYSDTSHEI